jgi:3-oxoacyl-[acyl-carrier protein] reductase
MDSALTAPQPQTLKNKVAIVTGSSRGIGASLALELARRGANVRLARERKGMLYRTQC